MGAAELIMKNILEDIKSGQLKQVYLLYGEEGYLRKQYRDKLKSAFFPEPDTMNCNYLEGKNINIGAVIDLAETMPFFAEKRLIIIENSELFKHGGEKLAEYMRELPPTVYFVFSESQIDKRSKLFKAVRDAGRAVEFPAQDTATLMKWILGIVKRENKEISRTAVELLLEKTGSDMENIRSELEKLICYTLEKEGITQEDVETVCTRRMENQIFDMINAIAEKRQKQALFLYYDLLALKEPPMRILFLIARQFNLLLQVKEAKKKGYDNKTIAQKTGLHNFIVGKYAAQAGKFRTEYLRQALTDCVMAEEAVKTGKMNDKLSVELLIIQYST